MRSDGGLSSGTRAVVLMVLVVVLAAVLAYLLKDGSIFNTATVTGLLGKFGYDGARDVMGQSRTVGAPPSVVLRSGAEDGDGRKGGQEEDEVEYGD